MQIIIHIMFLIVRMHGMNAQEKNCMFSMYCLNFIRIELYNLRNNLVEPQVDSLVNWSPAILFANLQ